MKTGKILLTALASLALSTAAYAADGNGTEKRNVYLADWTPQNPKAGEAIYINLTQPNPYGQGVHTTNEFIRILDNSGSLITQNFTQKNDYLLGYNSLSNIGGEDVDTWKDYKLDEKGDTTKYLVIKSVDFQPGTNPELEYYHKYGLFCEKLASVITSWKAGTLPSLDPEIGEVYDTWYTYDLQEKLAGGSIFTPTKLFNHNPYNGNKMGFNEVLISKPYVDGTYMLYTKEAKVGDGALRVAFISQDQYNFRVVAQKAADYINASPYIGSTYNQLVKVISTTGVNWEEQTKTIERLLAQYKADEAAVKATLAALPETIELGTLRDADAVRTLPFAVPSSEEFRFNDWATLSITSPDFTTDKPTFRATDKEFSVKFAPVNPKFNDDYRNPIVQYLTVNVMGLTKEIELIGRNPEMSWSLDELQEETTIRFIERGTITVPFYTFGYDGMYETGADGVFHEKDVTITQIEGATDEYYIELQKVASPAEEIVPLNNDGEKPQQMHGVRAYQLIVKFNGNKIGANDAVFEIADHFTGNKIKLNIKAAQVALCATDLEGNAIDQIDFPEEGGEKIIAVHYAGFQSTDEIQRIATAFNYPFTAEFVSAPEGETSSNRVEGTGTVYLKISCAPAFNGPQYPEFEILEANGTISFGREEVVTIPLTRTKTLLSTKDVNHYDTEIEMGGEKFESEIEFAAIDFVNYYSLDDIRIYTDVDVFIINDVIRWHKGSMKDGNFDTLGTVALNYRPNHADVITKGNLYIENIKNGKKIIIPLVGLATSQAKINELNGTTGIENIEAEGAAQNGVMFNVAGQRVNGAAKGLVIKNGKKFIVK